MDVDAEAILSRQLLHPLISPHAPPIADELRWRCKAGVVESVLVDDAAPLPPQNLIEKPRGTLTAEETGDVPVSVQSRSKKLTTQQNCFLLARTVAVVVVGCRRKEESVGSGSGSERLPGMGMRMMGWSRGGAHVSSYTFRPC